MSQDKSLASATTSMRLLKSNRHHSLASAPPQNLATPTISSLPDLDLDRNAKPPPDITDAIYTDSEHPNHSYDGVDNLVIICCHAVFHPDSSLPDFPLHSPYDEQNWHLAPFQKSNSATGKPGEHETFMAHLHAGLDTLSKGSWADSSLLVVSGGATKKDLTPTTEARSYYNAALAEALAQSQQNGGPAAHFHKRGRLLLEEHATDSFLNLLLSIIVFRDATGRYPHQIRVITHAFKSRRFLELHAPAIGWPSDRFRVQGIDPVMSASEYAETLSGEEQHGYLPWTQDATGVGAVLGRKRVQRGWHDEYCLDELMNNINESMSEARGEKRHLLPIRIERDEEDRRLGS